MRSFTGANIGFDESAPTSMRGGGLTVMGADAFQSPSAGASQGTGALQTMTSVANPDLKQAPSRDYWGDINKARELEWNRTDLMRELESSNTRDRDKAALVQALNGVNGAIAAHDKAVSSQYDTQNTLALAEAKQLNDANYQQGTLNNIQDKLDLERSGATFDNGYKQAQTDTALQKLSDDKAMYELRQKAMAGDEAATTALQRLSDAEKGANGIVLAKIQTGTDGEGKAIMSSIPFDNRSRQYVMPPGSGQGAQKTASMEEVAISAKAHGMTEQQIIDLLEKNGVRVQR